MDSFGNPQQPGQGYDPVNSMGNPFVGSNPMSSSMSEYMTFLQNILRQTTDQQKKTQNGQQPQAQKKEGDQKGPQGPKKWGGPNAMEISKGYTPKTMLPTQTSVSQELPFQEPQQPVEVIPQMIYDPAYGTYVQKRYQGGSSWGTDYSNIFGK